MSGIPNNLTSFNPPGEDAYTLVLERTSLAGQFVACVFYGMELLLFILTAHLMLTSPRTSQGPPQLPGTPASRFRNFTRDWKYLLYITIQFILCSIGIGGGSKNVILAFVDDRGFPGGPIPWSNAYYNTKPSVLANVAFIVSIWLQDGFLLFRFLIIWQYNWFAFILPCLIYLASAAFSILLLIQLSTTGLDINATTNQHVGIIFWSLSIALNVLLTALIVGRLAWLGRVIGKALASLERQNSNVSMEKTTETLSPSSLRRSNFSAVGSTEAQNSSLRSTTAGRPSQKPTTKFSAISYANFTDTYTSVGAMLIESAALYTAFNVSFLVCFIVSEPGSYILLTVVGVLAAFSPTLIAYRVFQGKGWSSETSEISTSIVFSQFTNPVSIAEMGQQWAPLETTGTTGTFMSGVSENTGHARGDRSDSPGLAL